MIDLDSQEVLYWINIYAVIFSILIISLAINCTFFIKDIINRILATLIFITILCWILSNKVFGLARIGYEQQYPLESFINLGFEKNIFFGIVPFCISIIALILLIVRLVYFKKKSYELGDAP
jgi:predicted permease